MLKYLLDLFLDFIFIHECEICRRHFSDGKMIVCYECLQRIEKLNTIDLEKIFIQKFGSDSFINKAFSYFHFKDESIIQTLIHELKYQNKRSIGIFLGEIIASSIKDDADFTSADALIPVPLHKIRFRERGYNQSELIAKGISKVIGIKVINDLLMRNRNTQTQTKLNFEERRENVKDAFYVSKKYKDFIPGKNFIIVDDVITTGSTINECGKALIQSGASKVFAISVAVAG